MTTPLLYAEPPLASTVRSRPVAPVGAPPARTRVPGLDGIRALSVVLVLLVHADVPWAPGGMVGVSVFFTLSGYLITGLLVSEYRHTGRIALGRFWDRRFRRLLPAATATIVIVVVLAPHLIGYPYTSLRPEAIAATLDVANWRQLLADQGYAQIFSPGEASPLLHFWSLAIEEQFYLVFPVVAGIALRLGGVRALRRTIVALIGGSLGVVALCDSFNAVYYNTGTRAGEVLIGALLAVLAAERPRGFLAGGDPDLDQPLQGVVRMFCGLASLGALAWCTTSLKVGSPLFEQGILAAISVASCLLILAVNGPGPMSRLFGLKPLGWIGERTFGIYLIHWPVYLVVRHVNPDWPPLAVLASGVALTVPIAALSYRLLETPIRAWHPSGVGRQQSIMRLIVPVNALALALAVAYAQPLAPPAAEASGQMGADIDIQTVIQDAPPAPPAALNVSIFGDSTSGYTGRSLSVWALETQRIALRGGDTGLGCPVARGGKSRYLGPPTKIEADCRWDEVWPAELREHPTDVAVVQFNLIDATDRTLPGDDSAFHHFGETVYDAYIESEVRAAATLLVDHGVKVVWITPPPVVAGLGSGKPIPKGGYASSDPARMERFAEIIRSVADDLPGMAVADLAGYLESRPGGPMDLSLRPDGIHFAPEGGKLICDEFLGEAIVDAAESIPDLPRPSVSIQELPDLQSS